MTLLFLPAVALAQSGGGYDLSHNAIAGGGATFSIGGGYGLGGTIGQAAAGTMTGGAFALHGGFWVAPQPVATETPTSTATRTAAPPTTTASIAPSATTTRSATPTQTASVPLATSSATAATRTPTHTPATPASPSSTPTASPTPTSESLTPSPEPCAGDCSENGAVTVDELIKGVNIALGLALVDTCAAMDANADGAVAVNELIAAVNRALSGCPSTAEG